MRCSKTSAAIVLAAGYSSRMGFFKPLSRLNGVTVLERVIGSFFEAGIARVLVVTGYRSEEVARLAEFCGAEAVFNPRFDQGMFTSVQAGVTALPAGTEAFFILPADIPTVRVSTLRTLSRHASSGTVLHPVFRGRRGHPPLVGASFIPSILNHSGDGGLRAVWESFAVSNAEHPVSDEGVLMDMDTQQDYEQVIRRFKMFFTPSRNERLALWEIAETPERVRRHCDAVASVSLAIGIALQRNGIEINLPILRGAALFHDVCRHQEGHVRKGEEYMRSHGFPLLAAVGACHKDLPASAPIEAAILHLSDKLVKDTKLVSLRDRKEEMRGRFGTDRNAWASIRRRYATARKTARMVERETGRPLSDILETLI